MWYTEVFLVFYEAIDGRIRQLETSYSIEEYMQWAYMAGQYGYEIAFVSEKEYEKICLHPTKYKIINGKPKYIVEFAIGF